jgi:hypothetical protein
LRRRCSAKRWESLPVIIKVGFLAEAALSSGLAFLYFIHPIQGKQKKATKNAESSALNGHKPSH